MKERRGTFVERVLDGHARLDQLEAEVNAWLAGARQRPLHEVLGLDAAQLELIAETPDALRYLVHARRFDAPVPVGALADQAHVRAWATQLASRVVDPFELAEIDAWSEFVDARAATVGAALEPSHA